MIPTTVFREECICWSYLLDLFSKYHLLKRDDLERLLEMPLSPFDIHNSESLFTTKMASNCMLPVFKENSSIFNGCCNEQEEDQCSSDYLFITFHFSQWLYLIRWLSSFINYLHLILQILTPSWTYCIDRSIENYTWQKHDQDTILWNKW